MCDYTDKIQKYVKCPELAEKAFKYLSSLRYLNDELFFVPELMLKDLFADKVGKDLVYSPIDIIELRKVLKGCSTTELYFSLDFVKKHLLDNNVFLGYQIDTNDYGNLYESKIDAKPVLKRIYVREEALNSGILDIVKEIVSEENIQVDITTNTDIPCQKMASFNFRAKIKTAQQKEEISLTPKEQQITELVKQFKAETPAFSDVKTYIVGGFVRDKLLGIYSDDIDICISKVSGFEFATALFNYAKAKGINNVNEPHSLNVVDKSATPKKEEPVEQGLMGGGLNVFGEKIEFIRMRTETYPDPNSRTPKVIPSDDAQLDAQRRDLTVNSLYYNIDTGQVEDFVGGKEDLKTMTLRTPSDPQKTFTDDPLRMLRVLRFFARYPTAKIDPEILKVMEESKNPDSEFSKAFKAKVSPDRGAKELRKLMMSDKAVEATKYLLKSGFYKLVFQIPDNFHEFDMDQQNPHHNMTLMDHTLGVMSNYDRLSKSLDLPKEEKGLMMLSTLFHDFGKMHPDIRQEHPKHPGHFRYIGHENESARFVRDIMTKMGFEPSEKKFVETVVKHHMTPNDMAKNMSSAEMGRFLHQTGDLYKRIMEHSTADTLSKRDLSDEDIKKIEDDKRKSNELVEQYRSEMGDLINRPLLNGDEIKGIVSSVFPQMVEKNYFVTVKGKQVHYLKYLLGNLLEQQWKKNVRDKVQAEKYIRSIMKNVNNLWKQQNPPTQQNEVPPVEKQASIKLADASSAAGPEGGDGYEGSSHFEKHRGLSPVQYTYDSGFRIGQKLRLNTTLGGGGLGMMEQIDGEVISLNNERMIVKWMTGKWKGKQSGFDLTDTISIAKLQKM